MHVKALRVENFKAIEFAEVIDLPAAVVIAGPNGCGKSCFLDALRIWKAAYGGYAANEIDQAFSEFGVKLGHLDSSLPTLFRDRTRPIRISASIILSERERKFLRDNADDLIARLRAKVSQASQSPSQRATRQSPRVRRTNSLNSDGGAHRMLVAQLLKELNADRFEGQFSVLPTLEMTKTPNSVLELIYSLYLPDEIGVFDYHSANRTYQQREEISNVDLRIEVAAERQGQHALFNWIQKYQNIKAQLVGSYVRELISNAAGAQIGGRESLVQSLSELFRMFFPDKKFLGVVPTKEGKVTLNVQTNAGIEHDITDLSSGEKEVLYGYLRMRNLAPVDSVLLLDEPELHLNPSLIGGLPEFYWLHLGKVFSNQLWLITHSDVLLERAMSVPDYAVFHMVPADPGNRYANQLVQVTSQSLDAAIINLVGEKAAFRPKGSLVIFEGGGDSEIDKTITCDLFPEIRQKTNPISGSNKVRVIELKRLLEATISGGGWRPRVYSITDRDAGESALGNTGSELSWDVYHIENYLLDENVLLAVLRDALRHKNLLSNEEEVHLALKNAANQAIESIVGSQIRAEVHQRIYACINVGVGPHGKGASVQLAESASNSRDRLNAVLSEELTAEMIEKRIQEKRESARNALHGDRWKKDIPGREILRRFAGAHGGGLGYEVLRNLIVARMRADGIKPPGMQKVVDQIINGC